METVRALLAFGANVAVQSTEYGTPLHSAAQAGREEVVRVLLKEGGAKDIDGFHPSTKQTPLQAAAAEDHEEVVRLLLSRGADPNHYYPYHVHRTSVSAPQQSDHRRLPLHNAASNGNVITLHLLLEAGADVDAIDSVGHTALHVAAEKGFAEIAFMLISRGATMRVRDLKGDLPLDLGLRGGWRGVVGLLLNSSLGVA